MHSSLRMNEVLHCTVYFHCCLEGLNISYESGCLIHISKGSPMQRFFVLAPYAFSEKGKSYSNDVQGR